MSNASNVAAIVVGSGFAIAFGAITSRTNFCTIGAISVKYQYWRPERDG